MHVKDLSDKSLVSSPFSPLHSFFTLCIFTTALSAVLYPTSKSSHLFYICPLFLSLLHSCRWLWKRSRPCKLSVVLWRRSWVALTLWRPPPRPSLARSCCCCKVRWSSFRRRTTGTSSNTEVELELLQKTVRHLHKTFWHLRNMLTF